MTFLEFKFTFGIFFFQDRLFESRKSINRSVLEFSLDNNPAKMPGLLRNIIRCAILFAKNGLEIAENNFALKARSCQILSNMQSAANLLSIKKSFFFSKKPQISVKTLFWEKLIVWTSSGRSLVQFSTKFLNVEFSFLSHAKKAECSFAYEIWA